MNFAKQSDNLPLLTEVVGEGTINNFPVLTEVVAEPLVTVNQDIDNPESDISRLPVVSGEEMQKLIQQLEIHLETELVQKLSLHMEQLQRQAIEQAVSEFKSTLPELLQNALSAHSR